MDGATSDFAGTSSRFRFKSRRSKDHFDNDDTAREPLRHKRPHRDSHHSTKADNSHRRKRREKISSENAEPDERHENPRSADAFSDPEVAFREALFDAMADDEGAAYWEGVYDQPLHIYPNTKPGPDGELERMNDEEYTAYVRARMYEKTHEHVIEEKRRREEMRKKQKQQRQHTEQLEDEQQAFQTRMEESLRRGEQRRAQKQWKEAWDRYLRAWESLQSASNQDNRTSQTKARDIIPWPVKSARLSDVARDSVEAFFKHSPNDSNGELQWRGLKAERVRWHPDKMQQRFGSNPLDEPSMRAVTAVFQVIDKMYNDSKTKGTLIP